MGKVLLQDDLRDHHPTQGGSGGKDPVVKPQHWRDHHPQDQGQVQTLDRAPHPGCAQGHEADRQYQRNAAALCGQQEEGHIFINGRGGNRLTLWHFEKIIDNWARLLNIQKLQSIKPSGREYHQITLIGLREVGERHHDMQCVILMCLLRQLGTVRKRRRCIIIK
jgi:hypothetical protein